MVETEDADDDGERNESAVGRLVGVEGPSAEVARQQLEIWFEGILVSKDAQDPRLHQVVTALEQFPVLARDVGFGQGVHRGSPLSVLIYARASLQYVRPVYYLFPGAISQRQNLQFLPLHVACERQAPEEVVEFLAREFPDALLALDQVRHLPIHYAMKHPSYARFATIQLLMELCPPSVGYKNKFGYDVLEYSLHNNYPRDVIDSIMRRYPPNKHEFSLSYSATVLDVPLAQALTTYVLPQLTQFRCEPTRWTSAGFVHLVQCLYSTSKSGGASSRLEKLRLRLPRELLLWNADARASLQQFLQHNDTLQDLQLVLMASSGPRGRSSSLNQKQQDMYNELLAAVGEGLQANRTLPGVTLTNFCFQNPATIHDVVPRGFRPRTLNLLHGLSLAAEFEPCDVHVGSASLAVSPSPGQQTQLEQMHRSQKLPLRKLNRVTFSGCCITVDCLEALLMQLPAMTTLQQLRLCGIPDRLTTNMTTILVTLLQQGNLVRLAVEGAMELDTHALLEALKRNTTLQHYHVESSLETQEQREHLCSILEHHNCTLVDVALPKTLQESNDHVSSTLSTIAYYLRLNQCGRRLVRNCDSSMAELVDMLAAVGRSIKDQHVAPVQEITSLQFGLLRELPLLWCRTDDC